MSASFSIYFVIPKFFPCPSPSSNTAAVLMAPSLRCDEDGWTVQENGEAAYPTFLHVVDPATAATLSVKGDVTVTYVGIGDEGE